jgi:cytochrome o ubiquinol oxidase subunit IV
MEWGIYCKKDNHMHQEMLTVRIIGFVASLILTLVAYFIIIRPESFHLEIRMAIIVILILAVLQFIVQFLCFLNLWREKKPNWNLSVFVSTLSVLITIIAFSIWIMDHLNYNMMFMAH